MLPDLPVTSVSYNHAAGRVSFNFRPGSLAPDLLLTLLSDDAAYRAKVRQVPAIVADESPRLVGVFDRVRLATVRDRLLLIGAPDGVPAAFSYVPQQHRLLHWDSAPPAPGTVTVLLSFPRSGSNFVQNILRRNSEGVDCASIYAGGYLDAPQLFLKSHALDPATLMAELSGLWNIETPPARLIILVRDPRDVFLSLYDYVAGLRRTEIDPERFLETDYYWYFFQPDVLGIIRDAAHAGARSVLQAYRDWYRSWITEDTGQDGALHLRYEDLTLTPQRAFASVFELLDLPRPATLAALDDLVSLNGDSPRRRSQPQGWRSAPGKYAPIIAGIEEALAHEIAALGY